jgi:exodeoxyribonuclease VII small subunit
VTSTPEGAPSPEEAEPGADPSLTYTEAMAELDRILREIEDEALDVDVLAARVKRAAELVRFCRARIRNATREVEQVVAALDDEVADPTDPTATDPTATDP